MSNFNERNFQRQNNFLNYVLLVVIIFISFYSIGYYVKRGAPVILEFRDAASILLSVILLYYSWVQNQFLGLQYYENRSQNIPELHVDYDSKTPSQFTIYNTGKNPAKFVELVYYDHQSKDQQNKRNSEFFTIISGTNNEIHQIPNRFRGKFVEGRISWEREDGNTNVERFEFEIDPLGEISASTAKRARGLLSQ